MVNNRILIALTVFCLLTAGAIVLARGNTIAATQGDLPAELPCEWAPIEPYEDRKSYNMKFRLDGAFLTKNDKEGVGFELLFKGTKAERMVSRWATGSNGRGYRVEVFLDQKKVFGRDASYRVSFGSNESNSTETNLYAIDPRHNWSEDPESHWRGEWSDDHTFEMFIPAHRLPELALDKQIQVRVESFEDWSSHSWPSWKSRICTSNNR